jgi:hypothetical protein
MSLLPLGFSIFSGIVGPEVLMPLFNLFALEKSPTSLSLMKLIVTIGQDGCEGMVS